MQGWTFGADCPYIASTLQRPFLAISGRYLACFPGANTPIANQISTKDTLDSEEENTIRSNSFSRKCRAWPDNYRIEAEENFFLPRGCCGLCVLPAERPSQGHRRFAERQRGHNYNPIRIRFHWRGVARNHTGIAHGNRFRG